MKRNSALVLFLLLFNLTAAQDTSKTTQIQLSNGIQFQFRNILELTNFSGYTISYRHRFNHETGIRIGLYIGVVERDYNFFRQVDTLKSSLPDYENFHNYKISVQYQRLLTSYKNFSLILGGGPFISYYKTETNYNDLGIDYSTHHFRKNKTTGYGIDLILGVEYKLIENVILSGEYGLTFLFENGDYEEVYEYNYSNLNPDRIGKEKGKVETFNLQGLGVNLGISVFF